MVHPSSVCIFIFAALGGCKPTLIKDTIPLFNTNVRHEAVNVSFSSSDGQLNMHVRHHMETFDCLHLYDDMNDVMEDRAEDGSTFLLRGSNGILLQSTSVSIDCRLRMRNQAGDAYTIEDVPAMPGVFFAYIVLANGETLEIEKHQDAYVALMPEHHAVGQRRRLQGYYEFSCKLPKMQYLKMGVVIDAKFVENVGNEVVAKEIVRKLWKDVSVPYEKQFNLHLLPFHIVTPSSKDGAGYNFTACDEIDAHLNRLTEFRVRAPLGRRNAAWHLVSGCNFGDVLGVAYIGSMGSVFGEGVSSSQALVRVVAHEIGHNVGMQHTFDHEGHEQGAGDGIMDYTFAGVWNSSSGGNDLFQFHRIHDDEACTVVDRLNSRSWWWSFFLVSWEERWATQLVEE